MIMISGLLAIHAWYTGWWQDEWINWKKKFFFVCKFIIGFEHWWLTLQMNHLTNYTIKIQSKQMILVDREWERKRETDWINDFHQLWYVKAFYISMKDDDDDDEMSIKDWKPSARYLMCATHSICCCPYCRPIDLANNNHKTTRGFFSDEKWMMYIGYVIFICSKFKFFFAPFLKLPFGLTIWYDDCVKLNFVCVGEFKFINLFFVFVFIQKKKDKMNILVFDIGFCNGNIDGSENENRIELNRIQFQSNLMMMMMMENQMKRK